MAASKRRRRSGRRRLGGSLPGCPATWEELADRASAGERGGPPPPLGGHGPPGPRRWPARPSHRRRGCEASGPGAAHLGAALAAASLAFASFRTSSGVLIVAVSLPVVAVSPPPQPGRAEDRGMVRKTSSST